jgi:hypothetical protein
LQDVAVGYGGELIWEAVATPGLDECEHAIIPNKWIKEAIDRDEDTFHIARTSSVE